MLKKLLLGVAFVGVVGGGYALYRGWTPDHNLDKSGHLSRLAQDTGLDSVFQAIHDLIAKGRKFIADNGFNRQAERAYRERWCARGDTSACAELCNEFGVSTACEKLARRR